MTDKRNLQEYEFCNLIEWIELLKDNLKLKIKYLNFEKDQHQDFHGLKVETIFLEELMDMEEVNFDYPVWTTANIERTIDDCISLGVKIIISSLLVKPTEIEIYTRAFKRAYDNDIFILNAMGNDNENIDGRANICNIPYCIGVSAIHLSDKGNISKASYTNYGENNDYTDFSALYLNNDKLTGTSFSQPFLAKKFALMIKYFILKGIEPKYDKVIKALETNLLDLGDKGKDKYFGKGLIIMPKLSEFKIEGETMSDKITINIDTKKMNIFGKETDAQLIIEDGRTYMPLREIVEALGHNVEWDDETRTITIIK